MRICMRYSLRMGSNRLMSVRTALTGRLSLPKHDYLLKFPCSLDNNVMIE